MRLFTIALAVMLPFSAYAVSYTLIGGKDFEIPQPPGMCDVGDDNPTEAMLAEFIRNANVGANDVVKVFADCKQLEDLRADKRSDLTYYGSISVPQLPQKIEMTREEYIKDARRALKMKEDMLAAAGISRAKSATDSALGKVDLSGLGIADAEILGELGKSGNTVQIGSVQSNKSPLKTEPIKVAGVATMSLIRGEQVVVNVHALYEGKKTIKALQTYADGYYNSLMKANEK